MSNGQAMTPTPRDKVKRYVIYDTFPSEMEDDCEVFVKASDHDAAIQQAVAAQRERDARLVETIEVPYGHDNAYTVSTPVRKAIAQAIRGAGGSR